MIRQIKVDGFRSLVGFELDFLPGLNVLVGPNGSGKTNIVSFLEFLGHIVDSGPARAVSLSGGGGAVFSKLPDGSYRTDLSASVVGDVQLSARSYLFYEYSFSIEMCDDAPSVVFGFQQFRLKYRTVPYRPNARISDYDLDIIHRPHADVPFDVNFSDTAKKRLRGLPNVKDFLQIAKRYFEPNSSLVEFVPPLFPRNESFMIHEELSGAEPFNIVPSVVRLPEDSSRNPGIESNGAGLSSTIYALQAKGMTNRTRPNRFTRFRPMRFRSNVPWNKILRTIRLANPAITDIKSDSDPLDNKLKVSVQLTDDTGETTVLPLAAMSDGTIKWIALTIVILATYKFISVEEPENYLHPLMQVEIVRLMRAAAETSQFTLLTTHSETILNSLNPEEIIVVRFNHGRTSASRPSNAKLLKEEISKSGFGLGYFYLAGSVEDE